MLDQQQEAKQLESLNFQQSQQSLQHISVPNNGLLHHNHYHHHQQYQDIQGGSGGAGQVKLEPHVTTDQNGQNPQQLQALRNIGPVKMELQHIQFMGNLPPVKLEPQHADQSLFLHQQQQQPQHQLQQQQQQQFLNMSRQSPQAAAAAQINLLQQQRLLQVQQQQQLLKNIPQQRSSMQPHFQQQNLALRSPSKPVYEPGMCARWPTNYLYQQQHRPEVTNVAQ